MIVAIYGAGGLGMELFQLIKEINQTQSIYTEIVFVDDFVNNDMNYNIKVMTFESLTDKYSNKDIEFSIGIGEPFKRKEKYELIKNSGYNLATLIHPMVSLPDKTIVEEGTVVSRYAYISVNAKVGKNSYIQPFAAIGHDVVIGDNCVISSHSTICGHCCIGNNSYIAINVPIREGINIGNNCIIGMGSIITKDIPDDTVTTGVVGRMVHRPKNKLVFK